VNKGVTGQVDEINGSQDQYFHHAYSRSGIESIKGTSRAMKKSDPNIGKLVNSNSCKKGISYNSS
jgi:hypothetical protein